METIYKLGLHERIEIRPGLSVLRVPGGWIYSDERADSVPVNSFVPFDNQYQVIPPTNQDIG